jgi:hypothetical protein
MHGVGSHTAEIPVVEDVLTFRAPELIMHRMDKRTDLKCHGGTGDSSIPAESAVTHGEQLVATWVDLGTGLEPTDCQLCLRVSRRREVEQ